MFFESLPPTLVIDRLHSPLTFLSIRGAICKGGRLTTLAGTSIAYFVPRFRSGSRHEADILLKRMIGTITQASPSIAGQNSWTGRARIFPPYLRNFSVNLNGIYFDFLLHIACQDSANAAREATI